MKIDAETELGSLHWQDGQLTGDLAAMEHLRQFPFPRFKSYGLMPGVSVDVALDYPDSYLDALAIAFPGAKVEYNQKALDRNLHGRSTRDTVY